MSIFTQVWLWSVAAFAIGVLLSVLLLVLPARKQVKELQQRLTAAEAAPREPTRQFAPEPPPVSVPTRSFEPEVAPGSMAATGYQPAFEDEVTRRSFEPEPDPVAPTGYQPAFEDDVERGSTAATSYQPAFEDEDERESPAPTGYQPAYEPESAPTGYQPAFEQEGARDPHDRDAYAPEPVQSDIELRSHYEDEAPEHESVEQSWFSREQAAEETRYYNGSGLLDEDRPGSLFTPAPEDELPSYEEELAAERTQVLPKRQPRPAQPGGFDAPQPIEPSVRQVERREPAPEHGQNSGSLFEPAVPPGGNGGIPEAPPAREFEPELSVPVGPFGPGSAMPKPGGGRPADEFSVKASVTALRYCTEDSPQFPRMVAEVWFRTAADAERVGFRPLG